MVDKPFISFLTPYYNEWAYDEDGNTLHNDPPIPIENFFDSLAQRAGRAVYRPGDVIELPEFIFNWQRARGTYIARTRNALINRMQHERVQQLLDVPFTHFCFVDADTEPTFEAVLSLLKRNLPIVSGAYIERANERHWCAGKFKDEWLDFFDSSSKKFQRAEWVGAGFLLVKKEVFEKVSYPWFTRIDKPYKDEEGYDCITAYEEDVSFCIKAKDAGYDIYFDGSAVATHHVGTQYKGVKRMENAQKQQGMTIEQWEVNMTRMLTQISGGIAFVTDELRKREAEIQRLNAEIAKTKPKDEKKK